MVESQNLYGFLTGDIPAPQETLIEGLKEVQNPTYIAWKKTDRLLRGWITSTLSESVLGQIVGLETSADIWKSLLDAYLQGSQEREFHLMQKLTSLKKGSNSINEYVGKFKTLCDELSAIGRVV
uniref:Retrotransposon gag domain-containing protein n=1 Tax=Nymphaea colorata TaxID=210225 RepID=A0A5K0Y4A1_9MAGN